jgi:hypothetical protein
MKTLPIVSPFAEVLLILSEFSALFSTYYMKALIVSVAFISSLTLSITLGGLMEFFKQGLP